MKNPLRLLVSMLMHGHPGLLPVLLLVAVCSAQTLAETPLPKMSAQGPAQKSIRNLKPHGDNLKSPQWQATFKSAFNDKGLRRKVSALTPQMRQSGFNTPAAADVPGLYGFVNYSELWADEIVSRSGVYDIPAPSGQEYGLKFYFDHTASAGVVRDGIYYVCWSQSISYGTTTYYFVYYEGYDLATVDPDNAPLDQARYYYTIDVIATAMTLDSSTGSIYAIATDTGGTDQFLTLLDLREEKNDFTVTRLGNLPGKWRTLACDRYGQLYGIRYYTTYDSSTDTDIVTNSELYKIDKTTGETTLVGDTGVAPQFDSDAAIDTNSGRMFWVVCPLNENSYVAEVDLSTGKATPLYSLPGDPLIKGLTVNAPEAFDKAPSAVTDASVTFERGSLSGVAEFTAPTTYFDGSPATGGGNLTATVIANGEPIATKEVTFGQQVSMDITVPCAGSYNFDITVENSEGISPKTSVKDVYVGNGIPAAPAPVLSYADGTMTLTWDAVVASADGGYIDPAQVTYDVTRFPDDVAVASGISATTFTEQLDEPEDVISYYYTVTANYAGLASAPGKSGTVMLGCQRAPFHADFNGSLNQFTVVNTNGGPTWERQESWVSGLTGHGDYMRINTMFDQSDDWLLTPPLYLEEGKAYKLRFFVVTSDENDERLEVKMGNGRKTDELTTVVLEPTTMRYDRGAEIERSIVATATGIYTIGFHAISDAGSFYLAIDDVDISEPYSAGVPSAVTGFKATAGENGALSAHISLTAPATALDGSKLESLDKIIVYRDGRQVKSFSWPQPGETLAFTDYLDAEGAYEYSAVAINADGQSDAVTASVFVGDGVPTAPANVKFVRTANPGEVTISWDPVTENTLGQTLDTDNVVYNLYTTDGYILSPLAEKVSGSSYTYLAVPEGEQRFMQYAVEPVAKSGTTGRPEFSNLDAVGTPYDSLHESGEARYAMSTSSQGGMWIRTNPTELGIPSQDGDDIVFALAGGTIDDAGKLSTGLVSLAAMTKPGITLYIYSMGEEDANELNVYVTDADTGETSVVEQITNNRLAAPHAWNKVMIPLDAFAGKTITMTFEGILRHFEWLFIDNFSIDNLIDNDLAVSSISAPQYATAGASFPVTVTVRNEGMKEATGYKVNILSGEDTLAVCDGEDIASNTAIDYTIDVAMDIFASEPVRIYAKVEYAADEVPGNNVSSEVAIAPTQSHLPAPANLKALLEGADATLTWEKPDYENGVPTRFTEDFETAESWSHEFGTWQFVDVDQSPVGAIVGFTTPGIDYAIDNSSFYIFDTDYEMSDASFFTHSGTKMLASLFRWDNQQVDDWAVSPLLDGAGQTISFFARSYDPTYPETVEVYYTTSESGTFNKDEYEKCATFANIPGTFTEYTADVPDGARRFAIRSCAKGAYLLLIDDISFYPADSRMQVEFIGYDLYRDGVKLNSSPLTGLQYVDSNVPTGVEHTYVAYAIYDKGASAPSNAASLMPSGIAGTAPGNVSIKTGDGRITVSGAAGKRVCIYTVDGKTVYNGTAPEVLTVPAGKGVYIVSAADKTGKVMVK